MHTYLIVANQTLGSRQLADAIRLRVAAGPAAFHVVVPATPVPHRLTWDEGEAIAAARERLDAILGRLHALGAGATGEIGAPDPVAAATDALREHAGVEEIILSTLPAGISRWLGQDVPSRLRGATTVPVTVVTEVPAESVAGSR